MLAPTWSDKMITSFCRWPILLPIGALILCNEHRVNISAALRLHMTMLDDRLRYSRTRHLHGWRLNCRAFCTAECLSWLHTATLSIPHTAGILEVPVGPQDGSTACSCSPSWRQCRMLHQKNSCVACLKPLCLMQLSSVKASPVTVRSQLEVGALQELGLASVQHPVSEQFLKSEWVSSFLTAHQHN